MGNPSQIAGIGMDNTALGGIEGAIGQFQSGAAQSQMYKYQAGVAQFNKVIADQNAAYAEQIGEQEAQRYGMQAGQRFGQIKAAQASHGLDINTGSAKDVQDSQRLVTRMDLTQIRSQAAKTAYNYETQGAQFTAQAGLDTAAAANARRAGFVGAASSIMGGASAVSSEWLKGAQAGLWGNTSSSSGMGA